MAVRTKQLAFAAPSSAGASLIYTVPSGRTAIIKSVVLYPFTTGQVVEVSVLVPLVAAARFLRVVTTANVPIYLEFWIVAPEGQQLFAHLAPAGDVYVMVSGTELEGVAP